MADIVLEGVSKRFDDGYEAVKDMDLEVKDGEFVILVGPSGCGKSTALRMIAGLEDITEGELRIGGDVVNQYAPKDRDIAMVFQNYALYPHMSVRDNMAFPLKLAKVPDDEIKTKVEEAAKILDLEQHLDRKPANLSGGQRQRVAMGRAIVRDPKAFLMDEPLSNLDAKLRVQMRTEVSRLQKDLNTTTVYVTHDQTEAMTLGDRVAVMRSGVLQQVDTPAELYERPSNLFVAGFIGSPAMNFMPATLEGDTAKLPFGDVRLHRGAAPRARRRRGGERCDRRRAAGGFRGCEPGRRREGPRPHVQGEDRPGRVDGVRALRLLPDRVGGRALTGAGRARRRLRRRRGAGIGRQSDRCAPRRRQPGRARAGGGDLGRHHDAALLRPAERRAARGRPRLGEVLPQAVDEGVLVVGGPRQLLAQALDHLVVPRVGAQQQVAEADDARVGLGLGTAPA